jgi:hypothetical protein
MTPSCEQAGACDMPRLPGARKRVRAADPVAGALR